jgi:phage recombination protein Bet
MNRNRKMNRNHLPSGKAQFKVGPEKVNSLTLSIVDRSVQRSGLSYDSFVRLIIQSALSRLSIWTQADLDRLLLLAERLGLDPLNNEIYAIEVMAKSGKRPRIFYVVGVDGWSKVINFHPQFDGMKFLESSPGEDALPQYIECTIFRKDRKVATSVREYMYEAHTNQGAWLTHPRRMLRHKAMVQCARICFGLSGIYDPDEAHRAVINTDTHKAVDLKHQQYNFVKHEKTSGSKFVKSWTKKITKDNGDLYEDESKKTIKA